MLRWCYARVGAIHTNEAAAGEESASSTTNVSSYLYSYSSLSDDDDGSSSNSSKQWKGKKMEIGLRQRAAIAHYHHTKIQG